MAAKIGTSNVLFRVGSGSPSKVFLGTAAVQTVPGAPTNLTAGFGDGAWQLSWIAPSDGGSPLTAYRVYSNGVLDTGAQTSPLSADATTTAQTDAEISVSAVNAIGEGPQSSPLLLEE
jgi:hypothetical protein